MKGVFPVALIAVLALGACVQEDTGELSPADEAACVARGGYVGWAGLSGVEFCAELTSDAGQMCSRSSDCDNYCEAETRTCSSHHSQFGCYSYLDEAGEAISICVD